MNDNIKNLYNTLVSCGYNPPALDQFAKDMQDEKNLRGVYSTLKQEGYTPPSFDSFKSDMGYVAPAAQAKPAAQTSVKPVTAQVQPTATEQNQEQGKEKLTWQQQMGMQMQLDETMRQVRQSQQDFSTRMENIRKGNTLGHTSEQVFNPTTGKFERKYYTTHGDEVSTPMEQTHLNLKYRDEWESTTDEGRRQRERRIQNDFEDRIGAAIDKYDPDNAAATVWQQAEERASADMSKYLEERNKFSFSNIMRDLANASHVTGGLDDNIDTGIEAYATHLKYHDLQRMADDAWNMLGKEKQQGIIEDMYGALKTRYPQATEEQLRQAATEMAREQSDRRMFELAVEKNAPQSATDYFFRKAATSNAVHSMMMAAARTKAGTTGDMEANDVAEQRFEQDGHKVAGIAGTVAGFAIDPLTWVSAGVGGAATKGGLWLGGRAIGEAATRKFATSLGGRMALGSLGGAANFGTYEAGSEALNQMKWGGKLDVDPETGRYVVGDYSAGAVAGQFGHGLMMGATTGVIAPYLGNVSDKLVRATESTAGKLAIRTGELGVGTLAEGTIFSVPDVVSTYGDYNTLINSLSDKNSPNYIADEQERAEKIEELRNRRGDAMMDVWTDNMAMIAGFKGQHLLKSAPRRIYELASSKDPLTGRKTKAGFETRLRRTLDGTAPDLALTADEREELERGGYSDLKDLTEEYNRFNEERAEQEGQRPSTTDPNRMLEAGDDAAVPYNRFAELMNDGSISEAARAKMYYYLTGNVLPMSTVMASSVVENKDADGNVKSYTVQSYGANGVVTSRTFNDKKRADVEVNRINRQVELNSVDVGERYFDWQGDNRRMYEACQAVSEETGAPVNLLFELMKNKTEDMNDVELEWSKKIIEAYEGLGEKYSSAEVRAAIDEEFGVDVDKAIRKEPGRRNEQERKAVEEYGRRLFADIKQKQEDAEQQGATPNDPTDPNTPPTTGELFFDYGVYDNGMSKAFRRGYDANEQERRDIAMELAGEDPSSVNYADRQEAWDGVMQRINNNADFLAAQQREKGRQMKHSDGSIRTATLKEKDEDGHEKQVYVVEGNVQMMPDGTMVDPEKSDNSVVIFDPATGERRMISPAADTGILSLGEVTSAEDYEAGIEQSRQRYIQEETDKAQGKVVLEPGQQIVLQTGEDAVVLAVSADGEDITVQTADGTHAQVSRSELQRIADEKALADYKQRHGITDEQQEAPTEQAAAPQPQASESAQGAPADYAEGMELTVRDEDGTEKPAMVMGRVRYDGGQFVPDENGNIVEYLMDGEVKHDHLDKMSEKVVSHMPARTTEAEAPDAATIQAPATSDTPKEPAATAPTTPAKPQARQTEEEQVIRDGIAGVGEGLRDAVSEQAAGVRENDINNWLQKPSVAEAMRKYGEGAQSVDELVQRALADNPTDETRAALNDIMRFDSSKQLVQSFISQPQQGTTQTEDMPMVGAGDNAEPDFMRTTPQRGHQYIYDEAGLSRDEANQFVANNIDAAAKALDNVKKKVPKMGTSIAKYNKDKATWQQKIADAQGALDYWNGVKAAQDKLISKEREAQHERDAAAHEAALAQAQADYEARKQAEAERKTVGNENPMPAITEKWDNATKVDGHRDEIVLPNGERVKGHYVLHESGAPSPSHNPETWAKTDGFPMDANDNSVNDRDYEQDADAQQVTRDIARQYDQRALQTPVVVSQDGVVLSGNGRTMAGELAARGNTDGAYIDYLREYAHKYGFTPEQVDAMQHPRVSFVPDEQMPYTAETFAKFNQQEMKSQNKTEHAVKLGKTVGDDIFKRIVNTINGYDTLGDFYNDADASLGAVYDLHNAGVVPQAQLAEMIDGTSGQKRLSAIGREMLENMLIGKAFAGYPEVVRMLTAVPSMRQSVITALGEIADNIALGKGWTLQEELADAVKLVYDARTDGGAQYGDIVSVYARQGVLFADPDELQTVADFNNAAMLMLADVLNDKRVTKLKQALALYNNDARDSAGGQMDLFTGDVRTREDILRGVIKFINNGKRKEIDAARSEAVERRKAASVQQDGSPASGDGESGQRRETENNQLSEENTQPRQEVVLSDPRTMSGEEKEKRGEMLRNAPAVEVPENSITSTPELSARKAAEKWWDDNVGEPAFYDTEAGEVEINRNSVESSLAHRYGQAKLDAITSLVEGFENAVYLGTMPDFTRQDGVMNHYFAYPIIYKGKRSYVFCRAMQDANKNRLYVHEVFLADGIKKGNTLQTAASQPHGGIALYRDILANVLDTREGEVYSRHTTTTQPAETVETSQNEEQSGTHSSSRMNVPTSSTDKVTQTSATQQENGEKNTQVAVEAAEQETDTHPTDAQKEAGNSTQDPMTNEQVAKQGHWYGTPEEMPDYDKMSRSQKRTLLHDAVDAYSKGYHAATDGNDFFGGRQNEMTYEDFFNAYREEHGFFGIKHDGPFLPALYEHLKGKLEKAVETRREVRKAAPVESQQQVAPDEQPTRNYTVEPAQYTTKRGKVLDMQLVKFDFLQASQQKAAASLARSLKGWWDKSKKGFMLRNEEDVKTFVDAVNEESGETLADHAPLSLADLKESTPQSSSVEETNASVYNMGALPEYLQAVDEGERKLQSVDEFMEYNRWALARMTHPEAKDVPALVKFAEGVLQRLGKKETGFFGGTVKETAMVNDGGFSSEKKLLAPYRNNAITWLDESNKCIYDIYYEPATHKGHPDKLNVSKEYFEEEGKDNAPANEGIFEMAERIANEEEAKRKEQSEALETAVSDFVERMAADPVVVGTIKRGGKDYSALENLVHDNVQGFLTEDPNRYVENGVLKAFSKHPELFRRIESSVRERVEEAGNEPKQEEKSGPREVDVAGLFNALKQGNDVRLSDFHLDKSLDEVIATAKRAFAAQSQKALKAGVPLEQFEKALKDRDKWIDELVAKLKNGEKSGSYQGVKNADYQGTLANILGQRDALVELLDKYNSGARQQNGTKKPTKPAAETPKADVQEEQPKQEEKQAKSKWVNDEDADRFEELRKRLRQKLRGQMNMGVDPEIFAIGVEMSYLMLKKGARKFGEFAKNLVDALGEEVRPYIKAFYNGARDLPEMADYEKDMTPYEEVRKFDVMNFDKKGAKDIVATAEHITRELEVEKQAEEGKEKLVEQRNEARRESEGKKLRPATQEDIEKNPPVYYKGKRTRILMLTHRGQQTGVSRDGIPTFSKPTITSVYLADGTEVKVEDLMVEENFDPTMETQTEDVAETPKKTGAKKTTPKKKSVPSQAEQPSLFDNVNDNNNEQVHLQDGRPAAKRDARPEHRQNEPLGESQRNEAERTDGQRMGGRSSEHPVPERERGGRVSGLSESEERLTQPKNARNNHGERGAEFAPKSVDARIEANVKAIELAQQLLENGETATPQQMAVLRKFSGWGGLGAAFTNGGYDWKQIERNKHIREMLGEEAYMQAAMSANSSFYTPTAVIDSLWDIARKVGFKGGKVLEGSAGIGNILAQMPTDMSGRSDIEAVEIDPTAGGILSLLYPDAKVQIQGFEQTKVRNNSVDLAITNVPFVTGLRVSDTTGDQDLAKKFHDIHDFCIAKNVRKLREGGLGIFITSNGTLDSSQKLRNWLVSEGNADVVGAFRLNNKTFGGTSVTSDIIVVRKRVNGQKSPNAIDVSTVSVERTSKPLEVKDSRGNVVIKELPLDYNRYFIEHPEMMAGEMFFGGEKGDTYRPASKGLYPVRGKEQERMLQDFVESLSDLSENSEAPESSDATPTRYAELGESVKEGSVVVSDGQLCIAQGGMAVPLGVNANKVKGHTKVECFETYSAIKDAVNAVLDYQTLNADDAGLKPLLQKLNKAYDDFVNTYGHLHKNTAIAFLKNDVDFPSISALEKFNETGDKKGNRVQTFEKTDIFKQRVVEKHAEPHPTNVKDGVVVSIQQNGRIDVPYIAEQLGKVEEDVKQEIVKSGLGYENPVSGEMEVSYQYLSGNVREKLRQAQENNESGQYDPNIKALQKVMPMDIPAHLIEFTLGSSWVSPKLYEDYVKDRTGINVKLALAGGQWYMNEPYQVRNEQNKAFGVYSEQFRKDIYGHQLIEAAIQNKTIVVQETHKTYDGGKETVTDKEATAACAAKVDEIRQDFKDWARQKMQSDTELSAEMERTYNEVFNNYVPLTIPQEFIPKYFDGASHRFDLRPHQGAAAVRATMQPLMLAHEVGTGKTFTLITTAMEMRRLGTAKKPMIVVQNATVAQFVADAKALYPNAKVLTLSDKDREKEGRKDFYAKIRYNDWDMIVVPQSTLDMIPDSEERQMAYIQDKIDEKMLVLQQMKEAGSNGNDYITKQAEREIEQLKDQLSAIASGEDYTPKKKGKKGKSLKDEAKTRQNAAVKAQEMLDRKTDDTLNFDEMGIDAILVDEAHEYKHLGFATAMQRGVKGVDPSYSKKSQGVYLKCQAVLEKSHGKNVVFATGTPISNTAAEVWTFMRYLMPADTMKEYGIYYFDDFVRNFGSIQQIPEFGANGKFKEVNRFAGYNNLPELERIWLSVADTVKTEDNKELLSKIPEMEGGKAQDLYLPQTKALRSVMKYVKEELKRFEEMSGKEKKANSHIPLTMYNIAKAAAVDARLVLADAEDDPNSKTNEVVRQTLRTLKETADYKGTVAIFADSYQNKQSGFNLYEDIRKKLIEQGVPAEQVVVMKPGMKINKKQDIFDKVNRGDVRVILGSTVTLGTGVNIQERLHTLIHIDAPNRPMDYTQRNGRILRQGNLHKQWNMPVRVLRFGVEDSLDVTAYQRLKTKGAIADSIMNGKKLLENSMTNRVMEEEEDVFGDTVAQLSGSEYAMLKNQMEKEVRKLESRKKQFEADQIYIHNAEPRLRGQIKADEEMAKESQALLDKVNRQFPDGKFNSLQVGKNKFGSIDEMADFFKEHNKSIKEAQDKVRDNVGESTQTRHLTLDLGGMKFEVTTTITKGTDRKGASLFSTASRKMYYSCKELDLEDVPVSGGYLKSAVEDIVENVITGNDFAERAERMTASAERNKGELEILLKRKGGTFEDEAKLKQAKDKLDEYTEKMKEELAAKEAKYAEMDAEVETATDVQAPDEEDNDTNDTSVYRLREDAPPTKTGVGYKVFVLKDGKLYPPMVANPGGAATPVGVWLDADAAPVAGVTKTGRQQVKAGGKGTQGGSGKLAYRPGWHLGTIPYALQFNRLNPDTGMRELFPANFVWAEVEYANDVDYQEEAMSYGVNKSGKFQHSLAGLPRLPENGAYTYRTNPDPNTDPWIITGAMKVNRILKPSEVDDMVEAAGREPQERQAGAVTDRQIEALNRDIARSMQEDTDMKRKTAEQMGARLNTPINIVDDVNSITHPNAAIQARKRKAKGWYDTQTGEVTVVLPNNGSVEDVAATVAHETIGHKGLRELVGEERYDEFLDETYKHLRDDLKKSVDAAAGRAFVDDTTKNGEKAKSYEQHRRTATDELFGRMAEKPFEEFSEGERTLWQKLKAAVRKLLDKFLGSLKLPEWFVLGDNELRYMLWRSKERMERGKEHPIDLARDIVKRQELGLGDDVRYMMGDAPNTFKERQKKAVEKKGVVAPGLNEAKVELVSVPKHNFTGTGKDAIRKAKTWAEQNIVGVHSTRDNNGVPYDYTIDTDAVGKFLSSSSTLNSDNLGVHLAVLTKLPEVIDKSIEAEEHPDYKKVGKERSAANGVGSPDMLVHRMYGAVEIDGNIYRVKTTMQEKFGKENVPHDYNVTKIELIISGSSTSNALNNSIGAYGAHDPVAVAKLLHNVEKSYDSGKKLLDESEKSPSDAASKGNKSLVGVHNISEEKLKKALKLGGLANPSIAVIDSDRQSHEGYGDISLVMPSAKIDGQGTTLGDSETAMFPRRTKGMTLDEISEKMKQNNAPLPITEYQRFVSEFIPKAKSLDEIRAGKGLLGKYDKKAEARREIAFEDVAKSLAPEGSKRFDTTGYERLYEAARHDDPVKFVEQEYGIKLSDGDAEALRDIVTAAKEGVTTDYFETKFDRPVKLDEFAAAIVPETADEAIVKALKEQGLSVYTYEKDNAGSRFVAMQQALADDVDGDILFRDGEETEDIWKDRSMGLQERITAAATRLAANHQENKTLRNDAMRAIGGNLADLRKAMSLQRQFDMTTVKRVYDLARVLMNSGYLNGLSQQEVKRLLGAVKNSVGHNDIEGSIQKVMDIMVDNQLKNGENALHQLETIKGSKVDARGVEVQGQLDPAGQHTMKVFKKTRGWDRTDIEEAIADQLNRMGSNDATVADEAALEYTGLQLALEYVDNITKSKVEERELREELKQSHEDTSERDRATDAYRQYVDLVHSAIRQNKIERAQAYFDLVGRLSDSLRESVANAKAFKEAEKQRVREIQHNANSDMEGRPSDEHYKPHFMAKAVNNSFVSFFFSPLVSFEQMMRLFGGKSANGEGYLYNRFMRGWTDARQKEISGVREKYAVLDAKAAEVFGGKVKTWGDLIRSAGKLPKTTVSFWNGGEMKECELGQGNLLYIYMVNKMLDGRMKLRKMGVTEQGVARLETVLDPRLIEIADWLQDEFLVSTRNEYNETHKRMFGASMAAIENYFPLKILANARADKPEDLDNPDRSDGISTSTGSIIKRRRNALALDLLNADALLVILDHVAQMEHWNAFAEFNRDLNTLRTYKRFRNQVQNMTTIYGSGKELWRTFNDVCQITTGSYRPPKAKFDTAAINFAKGVTAAKVSFRLWTAIKQLFSIAAYIPEARADYLMADMVNPVKAWNWSMENLPIFNERWNSRKSGDPRLLKSDLDWKLWRTRIMQLSTRVGMTPNAFIDAVAVSIGAHSMYKTRLAGYKRDGYSDDVAERKAKQDAEILYNLTQQSSEGAFLSPMQVDRSWISTIFSVFRNSNMSYQRQVHDALRNLKHNLSIKERARNIEYMKKQYMRDGIDEDKAEKNVKRKFRRQLWKDFLRVATFAYVTQFVWNLGSYLPYLLLGDDDDEKQKMWDDVWTHSAFGWLEGFTGGDVLSQAGGMLLNGEGNPSYLSKDMPLTSDLTAIMQKFGNGKHTEALNDIINLVVQSGIGVNPQSITDGVLAIMDACGDDPALAHEAAICVGRILQVPQSQLDKMYFDEVGLSGDEVSKYTPAQLAERYALYKVKRGRFFEPWSWNDEESIGKQTDKATTIIKERTERTIDAGVNEAYANYEEVYKGVAEQVKAARKAIKSDYTEAAKIMAEVQGDPKRFETYMTFKKLDGNLSKIAKYYLSSKSPEEATLCRQAINDYKTGMVEVLGAKDEAERTNAMQNLSEVMQDFAQKYAPMRQPNR